MRAYFRSPQLLWSMSASNSFLSFHAEVKRLTVTVRDRKRLSDLVIGNSLVSCEGIVSYLLWKLCFYGSVDIYDTTYGILCSRVLYSTVQHMPFLLNSGCSRNRGQAEVAERLCVLVCYWAWRLGHEKTMDYFTSDVARSGWPSVKWKKVSFKFISSI